MSNEILKLCKGYSRISIKDDIGKVIYPFYKEKDPIRLVATPWKMLHEEKAKIAVLCCHGYTGTPGELAVVGLKLYNAGFDVFSPRLPGHGSSKEEFLASGAEEWMGVERAAAKFLNDSYDKVYVVGHSMGGLNAILVAHEFNFERIALISPALNMIKLDEHNNLFKIKIAAKFNKIYDEEWQTNEKFYGICERDSEDDLYLGGQLWSHLFTKGIVELDKVRKKALKIIPSLKSSTLLIRGTADTSVSRKIIDIFNNQFTGKLEVLEIEGAGHLVLYEPVGDNAEICNTSVVKWLLNESLN